MLPLLALIGCPVGSADKSPTDCPVEGEDPYVELVAPLEGAVVCGTPLRVEVCVANIVLVPPSDPEDAEPGTGHVDIQLNGQDASMVWETETDISDVSDGEWQLKVELSYADHTPVQPYAGDLAYVTVDATECP